MDVAGGGVLALGGESGIITTSAGSGSTFGVGTGGESNDRSGTYSMSARSGSFNMHATVAASSNISDV